MNAPMPAPTSHQRPILVLLAAAALSLWLMHKAPSGHGSWVDDGVYLSTGQSLAQTGSYRQPTLPGSPWQTKYPPLWPVVLAVAWSIAPSLDGACRAAMWLTSGMWFGAAWFAYLIAVLRMELPRWLGTTAGVLILLNAYAWHVNRTAMSEALFTLLLLSSLFMLSGAGVGSGTKRVAPLLGMGAALGGAVLTRSVGVGFVVGVVLHLALIHRWHAAAWAGGLVLVAGGGWSIWKHWAAGANAAMQASAALSYDLDYGGWWSSFTSRPGQVVLLNLGDLATSLLNVLGPAPESFWKLGAAPDTGARAMCLVMVITVATLILLGLFRGRARAAAGESLAVGGYLALVTAWPFAPSRFLVPLVPLLVVALLRGVWMLPQLVGSAVTLRAAPGTRTRRIGVVSVGVLSLAMLVASLDRIGGTVLLPPARREAAIRRERAAMIRDTTPTDAVVAVPEPAWMSMVSGRICVPLVSLDPVQAGYPPDREFLGDPDEPTPGKLSSDEAALRAGLLAYYDRAGVTHVLVPGDNTPFAEPYARVRRDHPERFFQIGETPAGTLYGFARGSGVNPHASP